MSTSDPIADGPVVDRLRALHEHYVDAVNRAVADDRDDLVAELVADYPDEALALLAPGQVDTEPWSSAPERLPSTIRGRPRGVFDHGRVARWMSAEYERRSGRRRAAAGPVKSGGRFSQARQPVPRSTAVR